ncbi:hypothetical protein DNTS_026336 [Danionella cerebrum]|uniref:Proline-rich protein 11 n=1 Tax=Danionella cerebrum TaxID=2873325 RepID=A0A553QWJ7_9TELE|nr:hypothetical protein DNTS_026336 [Danionella translucida]
MDKKKEDSTKPVSSILSIRSIIAVFGGLVRKCRRIIIQTCSGFFNVFLFWRGYAERVESLHQKVEQLQREIVQLRCTLKPSQEACRRCEPSGGVLHSAPPVVSVPPLPPPPPPLPPPKILVTPALTLPKCPKKPAQSSSLKEKEERSGLAAVTLRDLQAVQLRKVTIGHKTLKSPEKRRSPLITLADLQKVRLRRPSSEVPMRFRTSRTPTKNSMNLRVPLRRVNLLRSPGGTPLCNKENKVTDSNRDPSVTRGLGNQFLI